jgi:signal peptidase I
MKRVSAACMVVLVVTMGTALWLLRRRFAIVTVVGESMLPTFRSGDRVLVRRAGIGELRPGVVVVVQKPGAGGVWPAPPPRWPGRSSEWMIKRVAALPGDLLPELPALSVPTPPVPTRSVPTPSVPTPSVPALSVPALSYPSGLATSPRAAGTRVPAGHLVVLGDNSAGSFDSRLFGYCPADRVLGVAVRPVAG